MIRLTISSAELSSAQFFAKELSAAFESAVTRLAEQDSTSELDGFDKAGVLGKLSGIGPGAWLQICSPGFAEDAPVFARFDELYSICTVDYDHSTDWNNHNTAYFLVCDGYGANAQEAFTDAVNSRHPGLMSFASHEGMTEPLSALDFVIIPSISEPL